MRRAVRYDVAHVLRFARQCRDNDSLSFTVSIEPLLTSDRWQWAVSVVIGGKPSLIRYEGGPLWNPGPGRFRGIERDGLAAEMAAREVQAWAGPATAAAHVHGAGMSGEWEVRTETVTLVHLYRNGEVIRSTLGRPIDFLTVDNAEHVAAFWNLPHDDAACVVCGKAMRYSDGSWMSPTEAEALSHVPMSPNTEG